MKGTVWGLFTLQFDERSDLLKTNNLKKMLLGIAKYAVAITALTLVFRFLFQRVTLLGFVITADLLAIVLGVTQLITFFFALGHTVQTLFISQDTELLFSLPASGQQVFLSKLLLSYVQELMVGTVINLPLLLVLPMISTTGGFGVWYYLTLLPVLLLLPVLPLSLGLLLCAPVRRLLGFLKRHAVLSVVLLLLVVAGFIFAYVKLIAGISSGFSLGSDQIGTVAHMNDAVAKIGARMYPFVFLARAMTNMAEWYYIAAYLAGCAALFLLASVLLRPVYFDLAAGSLE